MITTFDPPDAGILVEEYLAEWLGLQNGYADEGQDRIRFFAELEEELRRLKGRITIVSSPGAAHSGLHRWIWSYIHQLEVGANQRAVQHAKLWLFHWVERDHPNQPGWIEIVISSANLTRAGLHDQLQAGWRYRSKILERHSIGRQRAWGVLPEFLRALGDAAGNHGQVSTSRWIEQLGRASPPADIEFLASVPGSHPRRTLRRPSSCWGISGLRRVWKSADRDLAVMAPTIGSWNPESVVRWFNELKVDPSKVRIAWIPENHSWADSWQLDAESDKALTDTGVRWLRLPDGMTAHRNWKSPFSSEHRATDTRWSHAKLYAIGDGNRTSLVVTSANFSRSAWGELKGQNLNIENFELGVLIPDVENFGSHLPELAPPRHTCTTNFSHSEPPIPWLIAQWDGKSINIQCRVRSDRKLRLEVGVQVARKRNPQDHIATWAKSSPTSANLDWQARSGTPLSIAVSTTEGEKRLVPVADTRLHTESKFLCDEYDERDLRDVADALLEERYGFLVDSVPAGQKGNGNEPAPPAGGATDYSVPAYEDSRRRFALIDNWVKALNRAGDIGSRRLTIADGERIAKRWAAISQAPSELPGLRISARIAAEELLTRVEAEKEAKWT